MLCHIGLNVQCLTALKNRNTRHKSDCVLIFPAYMEQKVRGHDIFMVLLAKVKIFDYYLNFNSNIPKMDSLYSHIIFTYLGQATKKSIFNISIF